MAGKVMGAQAYDDDVEGIPDKTCRKQPTSKKIRG